MRQELWMPSMMPFRRKSTFSRAQLNLREFWDISMPEVATPPALDAFPGAKSTLASWKDWMALGVEGILAPSATAMHPFLIKAAASASPSSFWVAQGRAMSQGTFHGVSPRWKTAEGYTSA